MDCGRRVDSHFRTRNTWAWVGNVSSERTCVPCRSARSAVRSRVVAPEVRVEQRRCGISVFALGRGRAHALLLQLFECLGRDAVLPTNLEGAQFASVDELVDGLLGQAEVLRGALRRSRLKSIYAPTPRLITVDE